MGSIRRCITQLNEAKSGLVDFFTVPTYMDAKVEERPCFNVARKGYEFIAHRMQTKNLRKFSNQNVEVMNRNIHRHKIF